MNREVRTNRYFSDGPVEARVEADVPEPGVSICVVSAEPRTRRGPAWPHLVLAHRDARADDREADGERGEAHERERRDARRAQEPAAKQVLRVGRSAVVRALDVPLPNPASEQSCAGARLRVRLSCLQPGGSARRGPAAVPLANAPQASR